MSDLSSALFDGKLEGLGWGQLLKLHNNGDPRYYSKQQLYPIVTCQSQSTAIQLLSSLPQALIILLAEIDIGISHELFRVVPVGGHFRAAEAVVINPSYIVINTIQLLLLFSSSVIFLMIRVYCCFIIAILCCALVGGHFRTADIHHIQECDWRPT